MAKKTQPVTDDRKFILGVVRTSIVLLVLAAAAAAVLYFMQDSVRFLAARGFAAADNYTKALELVEDISDEQLRKERVYYLADDMYRKGMYSQAAEAFRELGDHADSSERYLRCSYDMAVQLYEKGELEKALEASILLGDYGESGERRREVSYDMALAHCEKGSYAEAITLFLSLGDYKDSAAQAYSAALALTGDNSSAMAIISSGGLPREEMEMTLEIARRRAIIGGEAVAAGAGHTVLRRSDGTVAAVGDNSFGQCNVKSWSGITHVRAGAHHTVGLREDGTVVAVGDNTHGQCDVSQWSGVVAIAAGDSDTIALTADGTVLCTGYHDYPEISRAADIRGVFAGSYALVVQGSTGSVISSHKSCSFSSDRPLNDVAVHTGYYAAIQAGGKCLSSLEVPAGWKDIACISGGPNGVVAADVTGKVFTFIFRGGSSLDFSALEDICQCAAGTQHYVFLAADGTVTALGDNSFGQCDTGALGSYFAAEEAE